MSKSVLEVLVAARDLISRPENWCIDHLAKAREGWIEDPLSPAAVQFCARGALFRAGGQEDFDYRSPVGVAVAWALAIALPDSWKADGYRDQGELIRKLGPQSAIAKYNNDHTHKDILALFDRAIASERAKLTVHTLMDEALKAPVATQELVEA